VPTTRGHLCLTRAFINNLHYTHSCCALTQARAELDASRRVRATNGAICLGGATRFAASPSAKTIRNGSRVKHWMATPLRCSAASQIAAADCVRTAGADQPNHFKMNRRSIGGEDLHCASAKASALWNTAPRSHTRIDTDRRPHLQRHACRDTFDACMYTTAPTQKSEKSIRAHLTNQAGGPAGATARSIVKPIRRSSLTALVSARARWSRSVGPPFWAQRARLPGTPSTICRKRSGLSGAARESVAQRSLLI
jgi:hypothetical protein